MPLHLPADLDTPSLPAGNGLIDLDQTFLPEGRMRQISRVNQIQGPTISAEMDLGEDHWVWPEHFPGDPVFPGTLMLEAAGQLVAVWAWSYGARGRPRLVRISGHFQSPAGPGTRFLLLKGEVQRKRQVYFGRVQVSAGDVQIAKVEVALVVLSQDPHEEA